MHNAVFCEGSYMKESRSRRVRSDSSICEGTIQEQAALSHCRPLMMYSCSPLPPRFLFALFLSILPSAIPFPPFVDPLHPEKGREKIKIGQGNLPAPPPRHLSLEVCVIFNYGYSGIY